MNTTTSAAALSAPFKRSSLIRKTYVANLDAALAIIAEIADRYVLHTPERQRDILKQMVSRVVINPEGRIIRIELKPPFNYLDELYHSGGSGPSGKRPRSQNEKTSAIDTGSLQNTCGAHYENQVEQTIRFNSYRQLSFKSLLFLSAHS